MTLPAASTASKTSVLMPGSSVTLFSNSPLATLGASMPLMNTEAPASVRQRAWTVAALVTRLGVGDTTASLGASLSMVTSNVLVSLHAPSLPLSSTQVRRHRYL